MTIVRFPDPESADPSGLLALGGDLEPESILLAYRSGIFPWPMEGFPLAWFSPPKRGILELKDLHLPRSFLRTLKRSAFEHSIDRDFGSVIRACAREHAARNQGTWITTEIIDAYCELHRRGHAHSVETWKEGKLAGGIYGVDAGGVFAAESMFYRTPGASMAALLHLCLHLEARGARWIDIQMLTPHMRKMGGKSVARSRFLKRLREELSRGTKLF